MWMVAGLLFLSLGTADAASFSVSFSWSGTKACSSSPPAFTVRNVPEGNAKLRFKMTDLQVPTYPHGGGTVNYTGGSKVPKGAFRYTGPCPPKGEIHTYQWTVRAVRKTGKILAKATAKGRFGR